MIDAVIIAGGKGEGLDGDQDHPYKALIPIRKRPMVDYVVEAVLNAEHIGRTVIVGPRDLLEPLLGDKVDFLVDMGESIIDNIERGINKIEPGKQVFVITSDIPLVTPEAIDDFICRCLEREADIYYPVIKSETNEARYPNGNRTYARLKEGTFTGGNMTLLNPEVIISCHDILERVVSARKNPLHLSRFLGFRFVFKFFFGFLGLAEIEERISQIIGYKSLGIISPYPEIGLDVDKPSDLELVKKSLP